MSQPQPVPQGGASPGPAGFPAYPGQPAPAGYPGQPAPAGYPGQPAPAGYPGQPAPAGYPPAGFAPAQPAPGAFPSPGPAAYPVPAPGAIPAPYSGQPAPGAFPPPYSAAQPGYASGVLSCRFCGSIPAVETKFRGHQGMVVVMRFLSNSGPFCRDCGLGVFRHMTSRTLVQGWYGYGSFIITPITVIMNLFRRGSVANLPAPQPNPYGPSRPPMDPGPRLLERPLTWVGLLIPFALISLIIFMASQD
ncbi:hypothetical protein [Actinoplanes regularis]|uniref:hypothetical protein n=1 Tax=Actinoplanes regularis TaxID=52697 RepID=UPI001942DDC5|nr:hypothetical protein [Actinoplanes regularis]GIE92320.1 hypothetical protein Are01nite_88000 [Actinoplanes regularis]